MGTQRLDARWTTTVAQITHMDIVAAWSHAEGRVGFVTADHRHGVMDRSGDWEFLDVPVHYASCRDLFPPEDTRRETPPVSLPHRA